MWALALLVIAYVVLHVLLHEDVAEGLFWDQEPWSYLEVVFWAITGTLVHLIIRIGSYLRWGHFYREGIVMHIAQMITIPLLALVLVWLLSTVELTVTFVGDNNLQLDLSDPRLLAAVSFLIGSRPWDVWDVLQETAGKITGRQVSHPEAAT